jgi:hypothetical protein
MLLAVSLLCFARTGWDSMNYDKNSQVRQKIENVLEEVRGAKQNLDEERKKGSNYEAMIEKEFEPFKYRDAIPFLHQTIISALPNEKNNPEQAELYKAFASSDVGKILEIPRKDRKQVFITNMSTYFSNDLSTAQFGGADLWRRSRGTPGAEDGGMYDEMSEYDYAMQMEMEMGGGLYQYSPLGVGTGAQAAEEKKSGFVVTIAGFSPYGNNITELGELMDPHGVEDQLNKWGFITRLAHLDDLVEDVNSPFEVYKKDDPEHFKLEMKEVSWDEEIPAGIGVTERGDATTITTKPGQGDTGEWVLVDPMTKETINKVAVLDGEGKPVLDRNGRPVYKVNDHWFVLNVKFVWTEGPEPPEPPASSQLSRMSSRPGSRRPVSPPSSGSTGGRQVPSVGEF